MVAKVTVLQCKKQVVAIYPTVEKKGSYPFTSLATDPGGSGFKWLCLLEAPSSATTTLGYNRK